MPTDVNRVRCDRPRCPPHHRDRGDVSRCEHLTAVEPGGLWKGRSASTRRRNGVWVSSPVCCHGHRRGLRRRSPSLFNLLLRARPPPEPTPFGRAARVATWPCHGVWSPSWRPGHGCAAEYAGHDNTAKKYTFLDSFSHPRFCRVLSRPRQSMPNYLGMGQRHGESLYEESDLRRGG